MAKCPYCDNTYHLRCTSPKNPGNGGKMKATTSGTSAERCINGKGQRSCPFKKKK